MGAYHVATFLMRTGNKIAKIKKVERFFILRFRMPACKVYNESKLPLCRRCAKEKRSIETQLYNLLIQESPNKEKLKTLINAYKVNNNPDPYFLAHLSFDEKQKLKELGIDI